VVAGAEEAAGAAAERPRPVEVGLEVPCEEDGAIRLGTRRPGTSTAFVDSSTGETLLRFASDENGAVSIAFCLYDANGRQVAESDLVELPAKGLTVRCKGGELLLKLPANPEAAIQYRLYNKEGQLLTFSDGERTMIYGSLRMEGSKR